MSFDERMMRRAIELAARGSGHVSPSPLVGCVIVDEDGNTIGEGYYRARDIKHAEALALEKAGARARGATAYVSLEPHAHQGRTPPCTDALIAAGIKRVVASMEDPNPLVSGKGLKQLRDAGLEVSVGVLARDATLLNEKYIHFKKTERPFVHLKLATSLDGRIATRTGDSKWITGRESRLRVHELRQEYDAVLVGSQTVLIDDPLLTDRSGQDRYSPLVRVVLDSNLRLRLNSKLSETARDSPVIVFASESGDQESEAKIKAKGVEVVRSANGPRDLPGVLNELGRRSILSLLVEGGATVAGSFLDAGLVDKVSFFVAPIIIGGAGAPAAIGGTGAERIADAVNLIDVTITPRGRDVEVTGYTRRVTGNR